MDRQTVKVLLIEDDEEDHILVRNMLSRVTTTKYNLEWAATCEEALEAVGRGGHDVYLLDYYLGESTGLEILQQIVGKGLTTPVIFLTGHGDYEKDMEAMRAGASDYLVKGQITAHLLERSIRYAVTQKRTEEQLRQAQKMEAIGTLAGGIAHDFNNILGAVIGFTEMAAEDVSDRPDVVRNLQKVLKSAMRARELVKQILAFSRKTEYVRHALSVTPLAKETMELLRASLPATVEIRFITTAKADTVVASPVEIQQILLNLATNAALAMEGAAGTLEISLSDREIHPGSTTLEPDVEPGEFLELMVKDTGKGITPDVMKRIFEPFFTTRKSGQGSGMGLAMVYGTVKSLRGTIGVESTPGVGSTFRVLLPKTAINAGVETEGRARDRGGKENILFVDDESFLAEWGKLALERLGYNVTSLTDSMKALETFLTDPSRFDLVVTDQTMPLMTGLHLAEELLKIRGDLPIILCTGHSESVSAAKAREAGIRQFLMKPLARRELAEAVRGALGVMSKES